MIEINDYREINKNTLKAQCTIRLEKWGGFLIKKVKIFQKAESRWISFPSEEYEKDGQKKYYSLVEFDTPAMNEAFRNAFFQALDKYLLEKNKEDQNKFDNEILAF
jgi:hypothetical protein